MVNLSSIVMSHRYLLLSPLFAALLIGGLPSCSRQPREDRIINVEANDAEMESAIATAREKLPQFWQVFTHPEKGESDFSLKVRIMKHSPNCVFARIGRPEAELTVKEVLLLQKERLSNQLVSRLIN